MAYRGLGNQNLGAVADLASVLDTLYRMEHDRTMSKERIAMQDIRESTATRRQAGRDKYLNEQQIERDKTLKNREMAATYDKDDLEMHDGIYYPKDDSFTRAEKTKHQYAQFQVTGVRTDFDDPLFSIYQRGITDARIYGGPHPEYDEALDGIDYSPGMLTQGDIPALSRMLETEAHEEYKDTKDYNKESMSRAIRAGLSSNKLLMTTKEYEAVMKSQAIESSYRSTVTRDLSEEKKATWDSDEAHIRDEFFAPVYSTVYNATDLDVEYTANYEAKHAEFRERVTEAYGDPDDSPMSRQYLQAAQDIFENENLDTYQFLSAFKEWDKPGRMKGRGSIAKDLFSEFGMEVMYDKIHRLVVDEIDPSDVIKKDDIQSHYKKDVTQRSVFDAWDVKFPNATRKFLDTAIENDAIELDQDENGRLIIRIKDKANFKMILAAWKKAAGKNRQFRKELVHLQELVKTNQLKYEDF